jgi:cell division topological specificity factor
MKIIDFLEMLFPRQNDANSRQQAKERLQVVLAHDRATVTPEIIDLMRKEILDVVARYVEVDREEMEFGLENSQRITSLIANFPIRQVKRTALKQINEITRNNEPETTAEKLDDELLEL